MPSFCNYRNCHNLASSTYAGYCNQYHYDRAQILELKERIKAIEKKEETHSVSYGKEPVLKSACVLKPQTQDSLQGQNSSD